MIGPTLIEAHFLSAFPPLLAGMASLSPSPPHLAWPVSSWLPLAFDPILMSHLTTPLPRGREWRWPGVP